MTQAQFREIIAWHFAESDRLRKEIRDTPQGDAVRVQEVYQRYQFHNKAANGPR